MRLWGAVVEDREAINRRTATTRPLTRPLTTLEQNRLKPTWWLRHRQEQKRDAMQIRQTRVSWWKVQLSPLNKLTSSCRTKTRAGDKRLAPCQPPFVDTGSNDVTRCQLSGTPVQSTCHLQLSLSIATLSKDEKQTSQQICICMCRARNGRAVHSNVTALGG